MDVLKAAKETIELWERRFEESDVEDFFMEKEMSLSIEHCQDMLMIMISDKTFSYGKQCRWLGWIQAACVANQRGTLVEIKEINKRNK